MEIKISSRMLGHIYDDGGLRDWFAGMALQGKMSLKGYTGVEEMRKVVSVCYEYADLMLEARKVTK